MTSASAGRPNELVDRAVEPKTLKADLFLVGRELDQPGIAAATFHDIEAE